MILLSNFSGRNSCVVFLSNVKIYILAINIYHNKENYIFIRTWYFINNTILNISKKCEKICMKGFELSSSRILRAVGSNDFLNASLCNPKCTQNAVRGIRVWDH